MDRRDSVANYVIDNVNKERYHTDTRTGLEGGGTSAARTDRLLTTQEVCELLKVSKTYIYWLTHKRKIPYIKMQGHLRFRQSDIDEWLRSQEVCHVDIQDKKQVVRLHHVPGRKKV